MIDSQALLSDLQGEVRKLVEDLRARCEEVPAEGARLRGVYEAAHAAGRTGLSWVDWEEGRLQQVAVGWVLACVFRRFLEDTDLVAVPRLGGEGDRLERARDELQLYFRAHPSHTHRHYLQAIFRETAALPAMGPLLGEGRNPLWTLGPTADGARALLEAFQRRDPETGALAHDFRDPARDTRFLGDLYQGLSESARKRYALLQTPHFVETFILDRTLTPAIETFGLKAVRLIDPACGSGHFLLGAFGRLLAAWRRREPGTNERVLCQRVLDRVFGVDLNPFAVAIARFRLLMAALSACGIRRLRGVPAFRLHLAAGDSLLHGPRPGERDRERYLIGEVDPIGHVYEVEDRAALREILGRRYEVVVANPPYITPKDPALNRAYRERFGSCYRKYSLAVPFKERCFDLARQAAEPGTPDAPGTPAESQPLEKAGYVGMITADSFTKREFGKRLIEEILPRWDLTHVIDASGAYIPGHGTPTVLLFGRHRAPSSGTVRAVRGIRGEPAPPKNPAQGKVWRSIVDLVARPGSQNEFVSVDDVPRETFHRHPWSLGGGGAAELKERLEAGERTRRLAQVIASVGFLAISGEDDVFVAPPRHWARRQVSGHVWRYGEGDSIRNWTASDHQAALFEYDSQALVSHEPTADRYLWKYRRTLASNLYFGKTKAERGLLWREFAIVMKSKFSQALSIAFAFVATHNHFVLDRGGKVFKQTAPVIKLPPAATEDDHLALLGILNSSTACFWMKQVFFSRGGPGGGNSKDELWHDFFEHDSTKLKKLPLPAGRPRAPARALDRLAQERARLLPAALCRREVPTEPALTAAHRQTTSIRRRMVALQEELDWEVYRLYQLIDEDLTLPTADPDALPEVALGERAFEIALARKVARGETTTQWFSRHGSTPITDIPARWPKPYRDLVERRLQAIDTIPALRLVEQPTCKRRWTGKPWDFLHQKALRTWLLEKLEAEALWPREAPRLLSTAQLADRVRTGADFLQVAAIYQGRADYDLTELVTALCGPASVPAQAAARYKPSGLRKRAAWEQTWELQRKEDRGETVGEIPVPPKYKAADFRKPSYWQLRGKLDVPKETFFVVETAERDTDPTPVLGWAGWTALEKAQAIAGSYLDRKDKGGWAPDRLAPLLVALRELIPWLRQWHNDPDPTYGMGLGDYFSSFLEEERHALGLTDEALQTWTPPRRRRARRRSTGRKKAARKTRKKTGRTPRKRG